MNRRHFLTGMSTSALLAILGESLITWPAFAFGERPKNFVLIQIGKGWDVTLGLDPRTHRDGTDQNDVFLEYTENEIIRAGALNLGPAAAALKPYASELAIINGVAMATSNVSHESNLIYISTGNGEGHAPDLSAEIAVSTDPGLIGVVTNRSISILDRKIGVTTTDSLQNYGNGVSESAYLTYMRRMLAHRDFTNAAITAASNPTVQMALTKAVQSRISALNDVRSLNLDFELQSMRTSGILLAAAFSAKAAFSGQISTSFNGLDSHSNHEKNHLAVQTSVWESVAEVFKTFKSTPATDATGSLWDQTLFMVVSEFARTPALNAAQGKDHNPLTNSVLLAGGLVKPGVVGASTILKRSERLDGVSLHSSLPIDFATSQVATTRQQAQADNFRFIQPEHVVNTVATIMGVDRHRFQSVAQQTPILRMLLK